MFWRRVLLGALIAFNLFLAYSIIFGSSGYVEYKEQVDHIRTLETEIKRLNQENAQLSGQVRLLRSDQDYLERMIRAQMKFVKSNEILYIFPDTSNNKSDAALDSSTSNFTVKDTPKGPSTEEAAGAGQDEGKN